MQKDYFDFITTSRTTSSLYARGVNGVSRLSNARSGKGKARAFFASLLFKRRLSETISETVRGAAVKEFYEPTSFFTENEKFEIFLGILGPLDAISVEGINFLFFLFLFFFFRLLFVFFSSSFLFSLSIKLICFNKK